MRQRLILGISLCILLGIGSFFGAQYFRSNTDIPDTTPKNPFEGLGGSLVYALSPEPDRVTDIYTYDIETGIESKIWDEPKYVKFSPYFSPNRQYVAFSAAPIDFTSKLLFPHTEHLQIYVYDLETGGLTQISNSPTSFRNKKPQWSPDGRYIMYHGYMSSAWEQNLSVREPDNWKIYLYDTVTKETKELVNGVENEWNERGDAFYYIRNDGLHFMSLDTMEDTHLKGIISTTGKPNPTASAAMTLSLSRDGKQLAWASPAANQLILYTVEENPQVTLTEKYRLKTGEAEVYHPKFSPDGRFLAVQETEYPIEKVEVREDPNNQLSLPKLNLSKPRITIYELTEFRAKQVKDLAGFDFFGSSLTQWIE